jgi:DNA-binding YbaB/EbfC family protein
MMKGFDVKSLMREAEKMQKEIEKQQSQLDTVLVEGASGGGAVKVTANANMKILAVQIEKEVVNPEDVGMLEDLILSAIHNAIQKAEEISNVEMKRITGGLLPNVKLPK